MKRVYSSVTGGTVGYLRMVYIGSQVAFETDSAGTMGLKYTWGPGTDNLLAVQDAAGNHYYATTDRLGSVRSLAKRDGTWLLTRRWDPYGNAMARDSSTSFTWGNELRYGWTGREYDVELGMYYHQARYYAQTQRRFIQEDPVASSTSPYTYVNGSPLEATDPSGMMMSYEMRMPDPREGIFTGARGPSSIIDGVPYDGGNNGFISGLMSGGGATTNFIGAGMMLTQSEQKAMGRMMTTAERASLGNMCQQVNCDAVHIFDGHDESAGNQRRETWVSLSGGTSITIGNNIYVADQHLGADGYISGPTLAHELTHVGQYQQWGGFGYAADGLLIQSVNTVANWLGANDPVYQVPLPTSKRFGQLNMEQQATVVEGCYRGISAYCSIQGQPYRF